MSVTISGSSFLSNQAQGQTGALGGAIVDDVVTTGREPGTTTSITNSVFTGNVSTGAGGAIGNDVDERQVFDAAA